MLMHKDERDSTAVQDSLPASTEPAIPAEPAPPITNRFLLVSVAAMRAKQLRKGASVRLEQDELARVQSLKPERLAREEIRRGLVPYDVAV